MPKVNFKDDELEVEVEQNANLRDVALTEGASIPFGCEQGICGTCLIKPENEESLSEVEEQEQETLEAMGAEEGERLACQCRVEQDVTVESAH